MIISFSVYIHASIPLGILHKHKMGRAKLKLKLIEKESARMVSFKKRSEGLVKKLHQLTTLCGIGACMIIAGPRQNQSFVWPPENPGEVRRLIDLYISKSREIGGVKTYDLSDFFEDRQRKTLTEVCKLRRKISEARYPTWSRRLDAMNESQLREFAAALEAKSHFVKSRIEFLKRNQFYPHQQQQQQQVLEPYYPAPAQMIDHRQYYVQAPQPCGVHWPMSSAAAPNMLDSLMGNVRWDDDADVILHLLSNNN